MFLEIGVLLLAARGDLSYQSINQSINLLLYGSSKAKLHSQTNNKKTSFTL